MAEWNICPCGRCGSKAKLNIRRKKKHRFFHIECTADPTHIQYAEFTNEKAAIFDWNRQQNDFERFFRQRHENRRPHRPVRRNTYGNNYESADRKR